MVNILTSVAQKRGVSSFNAVEEKLNIYFGCSQMPQNDPVVQEMISIIHLALNFFGYINKPLDAIQYVYQKELVLYDFPVFGDVDSNKLCLFYWDFTVNICFQYFPFFLFFLLFCLFFCCCIFYYCNTLYYFSVPFLVNTSLAPKKRAKNKKYSQNRTKRC